MRTNNSLAKTLLVACDMAYAAGRPEGAEGNSLSPYKDSGAYEISPRFAYDTGYKVYRVLQEPSTGFKAILFKRDNVSEYILAFAGTDGPNSQDWAANSLRLGWNQWEHSRSAVLEAANSALAGGGTLHITGQSLGGGLAEYAAFDLLTELGTENPQATVQSRISVTTFNGLGGEEVLRQKYGSYSNTVLGNVRESATFVVRNDIVSRLGGGHSGIPTYQLDFHSNKYNVEGKVDNKWFDLNPIAAHRIESGFYANLERGVEFNAARMLSSSVANSRMFDIGNTQRMIGLWGGVFGEKRISAEEGKHRIAAGLIAGASMGSPLEINRFATGLFEAFHNSGDMSDDAYAFYRTVPWGVVLPTAALLFRDQLVPVYANHIAAALRASEDSGGITRKSFADFLNVNYVAPGWDASPSRRFQRGKTLIDQIDPTTPKSKKVFGGLSLNMEEFAAHLSEAGPDWMYGTAAYLHRQAIEAINQQGLAPEERAEAIAQYGANLLSWIDDERRAIANDGPEVAQELLQTRDKFAVDDLGSALASLGDVLNPTQLAHANAFGNTRMDFANYDRHRDALADAIEDPQFANIRDILTSALQSIERGGEWVSIQRAGQVNPFDTANFTGEDSIVATDLVEGGVRTLALYLPYEAASNQKVRLTLSGASAQQFSVVRDGDPIQVASDGSFELVVPAGQREVVFGLRARQDIDSDTTLSLSAQLTDSAGSPTHRSHAEVTIAFDAIMESAPTTTNTATGTTLDDNRLSTGGRRPVTGTGANDRVQGLAGRDEVIDNTGNDIVEGGDNIDIAMGGDGNDAVYGNAELTEDALQAYIATSATAVTAGTMPARLQITQSEWLQGGMGDDKVVGASSNDIMFGGGGKDLLIGGAGHDVINGDDDYDPGDITTVYVEPGTGSGWYFDALYSSIIINNFSGTVGAADEIYAGSGDDLVFASMGADTVWGDDGNDTMSGGHEADALFGGRGNDRMTGDTYGQIVGAMSAIPVADDYLDGGEGDDIISGDGGADTILGGSGNDTLRGNNDLIGVGNLSPTSADDGDDYLSGGAGNDNIAGDAGKDTLLGGDGNDYLFGDSDQTATAYHGDDDLDGGNGSDYLRGYGGNDKLAGGWGSDTMQGEAGSDDLDGGDIAAFAGGADRDIISGGAGNDILRNAYQMSGDEGDDELSNAWAMWGGDGNDRLANGRTMLGGNGADELTASIAGSGMFGEAGADTLIGAAARDELAGGAENDVLHGEDGDDVAWGESGDDQLAGGSGADQLQGGDGHDQLQGDAGNDVLFGQDGNDTLSGGTGKDYLLGGAGNDTYRIDNFTDDDVIIDAEGVNTIEFGEGITLDQLAFRRAIDGTGNNRYVSIESGGGTGRVIVTGGMDGAIAQYKFADGSTLSATQVATLASAATNRPAQQLAFTNPLLSGVMFGTAGNDTLSLAALSGDLYGYDGNDTLTGGADASSINGGRGDDRIDGSGGDDQLDGSEGKDTYVFGRTSGGIIITDQHFLRPLVAEVDTIELQPGIAPADVRLVRDGSSMVVVLDNGPVQARVEGHFLGALQGFNFATGRYESMPADTSIEQIRFADGTLWNAAQIAARIETGTVNTMTGTAADNTYVVDNGADVVIESANAGNDTIQSSVSYVMRPNVERLVLTGQLNASAWANSSNAISYLVGNDGNNTFNGAGSVLEANGTSYATGAGGTKAYAEMSGGKGNDTYYLDYAKGGLVIEMANQGTDTVYGTRGGPYTLPANVEVYKDLGSGGDRNTDFPDELIGNALDNHIEVVYGSSSLRYYIDGGAGADTMIGSGSGDVYVVDNAGDRIIDTSTQLASLPKWQDEVRTSIAYELADNIENLTLTGSAGIEAWGNTLANRIDAASNTAGNIVHGGLGNDYYVVDAGDTIVERSGEGIDTAEIHGTGTRLYTTTELPANVENITLGSDLGASDLEGDAGNNALVGNDSDNRIEGGGGDDFMYGGGGIDTFVFSRGFGHDTASNSGTGNIILFDDTITASDIYFKDVRLHVLGSDDTLAFGNADLHFADGTIMTWAQVAPIINASQSSSPSPVADLLNGTAGDDVINALGGDDFVYGLDGNDTLDGGNDNDFVSGGTGADVVRGNAGNDTLSGGSGNDNLEGGVGMDTIAGDDGDDTLRGGDDNDTLRGGLGHDVLAGDSGGDTLYGGAGDDALEAGDNETTYVANYLNGDDGNDSLIGGAGPDGLWGGAGNDVLEGRDGDDSLFDAEGNDTLRGGAGDDILDAGTGNDILDGGTGDDTLVAGDGNDLLDGGAGADTLQGGAGIDTYLLATGNGIDTLEDNWYLGESTVIEVDATLAPADIAVERIQDDEGFHILISANGGTDGLRLTYIFSNPAVELRFGDGTVWTPAMVNDKLSLFEGTAGDDSLVGTIGDDRLFGLAGNDLLSGQDGNDLLDGGTGVDTMTGGTGNDTYVVDQATDAIIEALNEGLDAVQSTVSYVLPANVENLSLTSTGAFNLTGNTQNNALTGNAGSNTLDGKAGRDTMAGGAGNDTYVVDNAGDIVTELAAEGTDTVQSSVTLTLGANLENLTLTGSSAISGTGTAADNILTGNTGANTLTGGAGNDQLNGAAGADTLKGGTGNDTYTVDNTSDIITEVAGEGTDQALASATYTLGANVETLTLTGSAAINGTGNSGNNTLQGNTANNVLSGLAGADTMAGGAGNDTYVVDNAGDIVTENAAEGTDFVQSFITLALAANVENLTLTGTAAINATGNTLANTLTGNTGNNTLDGSAGADTLKGGVGNDTYVVDVSTDVVTENASEGTDLIQSAVTLTLATNVENLTLTGTSAINGNGNTLNNVVTGNTGDNILSGGTGNDTLKGGVGNDTYVVDVTTDVATENAGEGTDLVQSAATFTLAANIEYLSLTGTASINGTGNTLDNWLRGNTGINTLAGMDGNDSLWGDAGNDILNGNNGNDLVQGGAGNDAITDTVGNNLLDGGAGIDTLVGGTGRAMFIGGAGADTLTTGNGADIIGFNKGHGADIVNASTGTDDTLTLGGGIAYTDLKLRKTGLDLILDASNGDQITFKDWYQTGVNNKSVLNLQVVADAMSAYAPAGTDPLLNKKVVDFNFQGVVNAFDAALVANPTLTSWNVSSALSASYLWGSDSSALGGDLAYDFGHRNSLATIGAVPAQAVLGNAAFGTSAQTLQPPATLYSGNVRLA